MAETDNNPPVGNLNDPLKMRNTETSVLKRMPTSPNAASASSIARKTIKLKPLVSASGSNPGTAGSVRSVTPPTFLLNRKPAEAAPSEEPPKFMSTNTAPIGKMAKPKAENPISVSELGDNAAPTKTVSIPRLQARTAARPPSAVPVVESAPTVAVPKITPAAAPGTISTATVAVPKITPAPVSGNAPAVAEPKITSAAAPGTISTATVAVPKTAKPEPAPVPAPGKGSTATVSVPKINKPAQPAGKPTYISTATAAVPPLKRPAPSAPVSSDVQSAAEAATRTQGIQRQAIAQAKMQSGLQEAKPAIKLRPSASPAQEPEALTATSPTIKLTPKTESAVTPMPPTEPQEAPKETPQEAPKAAGKEEEITVTTKIPRSKLQLKPSKPSMPGQDAAGAQPQLRTQGDIANQKIKEMTAEGEQVITQIHTEKKSKASKTKSNEPHIVFAICAILAFLVVGYMVFAMTAQFLNTWEQKSIPVVGFQQLDEQLKK